MANKKSNYLASKIYNHTLRNVAYTPPTSVYIALYSAIVNGDTETMTELTGNGYARQLVTFGADTNVGANSLAVAFPLATASWLPVVGVAIKDALTGGRVLYYGDLLPNKTIETGEQLAFPAGSIIVEES